MAAPQIPNLLSLRKDGNSRGRERGRGGAGISGVSGGPSRESQVAERSPEIIRAENDKIVQATDTDANISRMSAVAAGYLTDPFARAFSSAGEVQRRYPIINRGTYARTTAVDKLVEDFLYSKPETQKQIISLGAGSDTRYFRLASRPDPPNVIYHELDFAVNTQRKLAIIVKSEELKNLVGDPFVVRWAESELHGPHYHVHAVDLRELDPSKPWTGPVALNHIDPQLPTLLISECCLTYIAPNEADAVVGYFAKKLLAPGSPLGIVLYEPINPFDSFGQVMVKNLAARGIVMQTLHQYGSLDAQRARLAKYGLVDGQRAMDIDFMQKIWLDGEEQRRISQVEMLDEVEELNLLAKHYCIAWAWRDGSEQFAGLWDRWKDLEEQEP